MRNNLFMSRNVGIAKLISKWAKHVGRGPAIGRLIERGVNVSVAEKLCTGRYKSEPRDLLANVLLDEMAKDGFRLASEEAS